MPLDNDVTPKEDQSIYVCAIDMDSCVFNKKFLSLLKQHAYQLKPQELEELIEESNPNLINHILDMAKNHSKTILMLGSNRQFLKTDFENGFNKSLPFQTGSATLAIEAIHRIVSRKNKTIFHDPYLLEDAFQDSTKAQSHQKFKEHYESEEFKKFYESENFTKNNKDEAFQGHGKPPETQYADASKITMVYVQTHRIASQHPEAAITYQLIDDIVSTILDPVQSLFDDYPELKPHKTFISCLQYGIKENARNDEKETENPPAPSPIRDEKKVQMVELKQGEIDHKYHTNFKNKINAHFKAGRAIEKLDDVERAALVFDILAERNGKKRDITEEFNHATCLYAKKWGKAESASLTSDAEGLRIALSTLSLTAETRPLATELLHRTNTLLKRTNTLLETQKTIELHLAQKNYKEILDKNFLPANIISSTNKIYRKTFLLDWEYYQKKWETFITDEETYKTPIKQAIGQLLNALKLETNNLTNKQLLQTQELLTILDSVITSSLSVTPKRLEELFDIQNKFPPPIQNQIAHVIKSMVTENHNYCLASIQKNPDKGEAKVEIKDDAKAAVIESFSLKEMATVFIQKLIRFSNVSSSDDKGDVDDSIIPKKISNNQPQLIATIKLLHLTRPLLSDSKSKIDYSTIVQTAKDLSFAKEDASRLLRCEFLRTCDTYINLWLNKKNNTILQNAIELVSLLKTDIEKIKDIQLADADKLLDAINALIDNPRNNHLYDTIIGLIPQFPFVHPMATSILSASFQDVCTAYEKREPIEYKNNNAIASNELATSLTRNKEHIHINAFSSVICLLKNIRIYDATPVDTEIALTNLISNSKDVINKIQKNANKKIIDEIDLDKFKIKLSIDNNDLKNICEKYCNDWTMKNTSSAAAAYNLGAYIYQDIKSIPDNEKLLVVELLHRTNTLINNLSNEVARERFFSTLNSIPSIKNPNTLPKMDLDFLITQITSHHPTQELKHVLNSYQKKWAEKKDELACRQPARDLLSRLDFLEKNNQIPKEEKVLAIKLLHRTDTLIHYPDSQLAQERYATTLTEAKNKTQWGKIILGTALVVLGVALMAGAAALAISTFGAGAPLSFFVTKASIAVILKGLIIGGIVSAGLTGTASFGFGAAMTKHGIKKQKQSPKYTYLPQAQRFFETVKKSELEDKNPPITAPSSNSPKK